MNILLSNFLSLKSDNKNRGPIIRLYSFSNTERIKRRLIQEGWKIEGKYWTSWNIEKTSWNIESKYGTSWNIGEKLRGI